MTVVALSVSFRTVPLSELARLVVPRHSAGEALARLIMADEVREVSILSTCNRSEVYAWVGDPGAAVADLHILLEDLWDVPRGWLRRRCTKMIGAAAVEHLHLVTAGLDSMVPGESQIQGQVRDAYRTAAESGTLGPHLHLLFRSALESGKKARATSRIDRIRRSIPKAGVEALAGALDGLHGRHVVVVGNGKMATAAVEDLHLAGATIQVAARRPEVAPLPASGEHPCPIPIAEIDQALVTTDAVIFATTAPHVLFPRDRAARVAKRRGGRPLVVLDLGMPRNVAPEAGELDGLHVYDLARLHDEGYTSARGLEDELDRAREVVAAEALACVTRLRARAASDFGTRVHALAAEVAAIEAERVFRKVPDLDEQGREAVTVAVNRAVRKLLYAPTVRGREAAEQGQEDVLAVAWWLFGLEDHLGPPEGHPESKPSRVGAP